MNITCGGNASKSNAVKDLPFTGTAAGFLLFGIPPNALSVLLIMRAKQTKSNTAYFLLNLALADIVNLLSTLLIGVFSTIGVRGTVEDTVNEIPVLAKAVANMTLALIAYERYNGLVKTMDPFVEMDKRKVKIILAVTWVTSCTFFALPLIFRLVNEIDRSLQVLYYAVCVAVVYVFPLVVVGYCYGKIFTGVSTRGTILGRKTADKRALGEKKRFVRTMFVVTVIFMACNLPAVAVKIMKTSRYRFPRVGFYKILLLLGCVSSAINPYIYGLRSEKYRKQVRQLLCCEDGEKYVVEDNRV